MQPPTAGMRDEGSSGVYVESNGEEHKSKTCAVHRLLLYVPAAFFKKATRSSNMRQQGTYSAAAVLYDMHTAVDTYLYSSGHCMG